MSAQQERASEYLVDYARLLRHLAEQREHDRKGTTCTGVGGCKRCTMVRKAEDVDRIAAELPEKLEIPDEVLGI